MSFLKTTRNRIAQIAAVILCWVLTTHNAAATPNLITNGSFESGSTGWTSLSGGAGLEVSANPGTYGIPAAPAGTAFCEVEVAALSPTSTPDYIQQTLTTISGKTYIISIAAVTRLNANTLDRMIINAAGNNLATIITGSTWAYYSNSFVAASTSSVIRYVSNGSATGSIQPGDSVGLMVDDAQVQQLLVSPTAQSIAEDASFSTTTFQVATNSTSTTSLALSVAHGKLTLGSTTGLTFSSGGNGTASFTITGTPAAINAALTSGLSYNPIADYNGSDLITALATSGTATQNDTVGITITPVADIVADNLTTTENTALTYNAILGTNGASADSFENTPTAVSVTSPVHGTAVASSTTIGQIVYTPNAGYFGSDSYTYTVTSGGVTETASQTITINPSLPSMTITKISNGGVGTFNFTATNGFTNQAVSTTTAGVGVSGATQFLTTAGLSTSVSEVTTPAYLFASATCLDTNSANTGKTGNFGAVAGSTITVPASNIILGAAITCTFTNTKVVPSMLIIKNVSSAGPFSLGQTITYTYTVTNTGNVPMSAVSISDIHNGTGIFTGPFGETLSNDAAPLGDSTDATGNNGVWSSLGIGDTATFTATYVVSQHDIDYLQ